MATNKPIIDREYTFPDGVLEQLADFTVSNLTRDLAELASRGVTQATIDNLIALRQAFSDLPTDGEARGTVGIAVENKDAARDAAIIEARRLRTAAQNVFGEETAMYRSYGFVYMDRLREDALPRQMRRMHRVGTETEAQLAPEGIDAAFLTAFLAAITAFDDALDAIDNAEAARDKLTEDRSISGNTLYSEVVRVCNIGKDVFAPVSEALYNDYVIENFVGGGSSESIPATSLIVKGKVVINETTTPVVGAQVSLENIPGTGQLFTNTDGEGNYEFNLTDLPAGEMGTLALTVNAPGFEFYSQNFDAQAGHVYTIDVQLVQQMQAAA